MTAHRAQVNPCLCIRVAEDVVSVTISAFTDFTVPTTSVLSSR